MTEVDKMIQKFLSDNHFGKTADASASMAIFEFEHLLNKLDLLNRIFDGEESEGKKRIERMVKAMKGVNK